MLSDHGQTQGATFLQRNGYGLDELVERNLRGPAWRPPAAATRTTPPSPRPSRGDRPQQKDVDKHQVGDRKVIVIGSGNLGLIYLMDEPRRMTMEEIDSGTPTCFGAARRIRTSAGCSCARESTAQWRWARAAHYLSEGRVEGEDPLRRSRPRPRPTCCAPTASPTSPTSW